MTWTPVTLQWPTQATQFLDDLAGAKQLASATLDQTATRIQGLASIATTAPGAIVELAKQGIEAGRAAITETLGEVPTCLVATPFQAGVGQGIGMLRALSAPNLVQHLGTRLQDSTDAALPSGDQHALVVLFLGARYDQLANTLAGFNQLLPFPDLQRAERRAQQLFKLEIEKWEIPTAVTVPGWGQMPLERCTITKAASQALSSQVAVLESYAAASSPLADLDRLAAKKVEQAQGMASQLTGLIEQLAGNVPNTSMQVRLLGPGTPAELGQQLLDGETPGHEFGMCAGVVLVGSLPGLGFVREMLGL